uniref:Thioredoxin domain-containing protein n=1 Tax=Haemonchus placei TaxID=6290 RepID=A0A0N4VX87_HAEPC
LFVLTLKALISVRSEKRHKYPDWCLLFYSPTCPFSARVAPYFNALPHAIILNINFSRLNTRYGVSGTPTIMLWVSGAAVARMEDRSLNDNGLMVSFARHTFVHLRLDGC